MGKGKTAIVLSAIKQLPVKGTLVVAPLRVIKDVWPTEIQKWAQFSHLTYITLHGPKKALKPGFDLYLINYEGLVWLKEQIDQIARSIPVSQRELSKLHHLTGRKGARAAIQRIHKASHSAYDLLFICETARLEKIEISDYEKAFRAAVPFNCIVFDEITRLKHHSTKRFKAWREVMALFKRRIGMTGTPAANGYQDLWGQFYMLDDGRRLGRTITSFRKRWMRPVPYVDYQSFELLPGAEEQIHNQIQDIIFEVDPKDQAGEKPIINDILVTLPDRAMRVYDEMRQEFHVELQERGIEAWNSGGRALKLLQIANGAVYVDRDRNWEEIHDVKLQVLDEVLEEAAGNSVLVAYSFIHDVERIKTKFPFCKTIKDKDVVNQWNDGAVRLLAIHPASAGHGLNLQFGGNQLLWFGLPASRNLEHYQQTCARLVGRHGQTRQVVIHRVLARNTLDLVVRKQLSSKKVTQEGLLQAIYAVHQCST